MSFGLVKIATGARTSAFVDERARWPTTTAGGDAQGGNGVRMPGLPWKYGRTAIERATAFMRDQNRPNVFRFESIVDDCTDLKSTHNELQTLWCYFPAGHPLASGPVPNMTEFWQAWSFMVEPGPKTTAVWSILGQWHATEDNANTAPGRDPDDALSPPFCINLTAGDRLAVTTRTDAQAQNLASRFPVERFEYLAPSALERARWHHVVTNIKFDWTGAGKCCVWLDGVQIVNQAAAGYSIGYNDVQGPHWNFGIYRGLYATPGDASTLSDPNPFACRFANMEFSFQSLAGRIANPLPI